jgi:hypothetical protein
MKNYILIFIALGGLMPIGALAQATEETTTETVDPTIVECSSQAYFADNQCQVCYDGGEITPDTKGVKLNEQDMSWENTLSGINQNFYETSQSIAEIKTNIGTPITPWDETGLEWGPDVIWKDNDGLNYFTLVAGNTIKIKTIKDATEVALTSPKQPANPYFVVKVPISYYELKMGTFNESEKKTKTYCVGYKPKKVAGTTTTQTPNTQTTTPSTTTTPTTSNPPLEKSTNPEQSTETVIPEKLVERDPEEILAEDTTEEEIPVYNAKVSLNSAGTDPTASEASRIQTGPAENMLVLIAALLLSMVCLPKINRIFIK